MAACSSGGQGSEPPQTTVNLALSDGGCAPQPASVPAGPVSFNVTNQGSTKVTEGEIQKDNRILGEKENITAGLSGDFSLRLDPGQYSVYCPGAAQDTAQLTVTGQGGAPTTAPADTNLSAATSQYKQYVIAEVGALVPATKQFTDAVRAGDVDRAKQLYSPARYHYETIEPVAESPEPQLPVSFSDATGTDVEVTDISRILALDLYGTLSRTVEGLGLTENIIGRTVSSNEPAIADRPERRALHPWTGGWCRGRGSNPRPSVYKTAALPLCYTGPRPTRAAL